MKFNLSRFRDLGKCSLGTLKDEWDTDKDKIYVGENLYNPASVEIKQLTDLFPYLWANPFVTTGGREAKTNNHFFVSSPEPWFVSQYGRYLDDYKAELERRTKNFKRAKNKQLAQGKIDYCIKRIENLETLIADLRNEMLNNQKELLEDNVNG